jgi:hypothetical protein
MMMMMLISMLRVMMMMMNDDDDDVMLHATGLFAPLGPLHGSEDLPRLVHGP